MNYMPDEAVAWGPHALFDLYDLAGRIDENAELESPIRASAKNVTQAVDRLVVASVGMEGYRGFEPGKNGLYIMFPDGDAVSKGRRQWTHYDWYSPDDRRTQPGAYGNLLWCADGAARRNEKVGNWYELLGLWYGAKKPPDGEAIRNGG